MTMPFITVMDALYAELAIALAGQAFGFPKAIKVRPWRHRNSKSDEWPVLAIRYVSNDRSNIGRETTSGGLPEQVWELAVNLVIDMPIAPEGSEPYALDDQDPTGFGNHAAVIETVINHLFPASDFQDSALTLGGTVWDIQYDGTADNDDADRSPDYVRMEERLTLFYRVRSDRPSILLMGS